MKKFSDYLKENEVVCEGMNFNTPQYIEKVKREYEKIAKEKLDIEILNGDVIYAYGSELATLRLYKAYYHGKPDIKADYSSNLKKFYFRNEINS